MKEQKRTPCNRMCDCEWGSKRCHEKRGYIWNYVTRSWCRDPNGGYSRTANRECDYVVPYQMRLF